MKTKTLLTSLLLLLGLGSYTILNSSYSLGFASYSNTTCPTCHSASAPSTSIAVNGLPTFYNLNQAYPVSVTITNTSKLIAGFQIRSNIGTFTTSDPSISIYADNRSAGHNVPKGMTAGVATFNLIWTAPASGATAANFGAQGIGADGTGNTNNDSGVFTTVSNISLPVILSNVRAYTEEDKVAILFTTEQEESIDKLEVEKSTNGMDFETLEVHTPKGNGFYTSYDKDVVSGTTYFYRIKETSLDNETSFSNVVSVNFRTAEKIEIYPTLVENKILHIKGLTTEEDYRFSLFSLSGKLIKKVNKLASSIDLGDLPAGFYLAKITNADGQTIKQKIQIR